MGEKSCPKEDLSGLTKQEMYSILMQLKRSTKFPIARRIYEKTLRFFDDKCPGCDAGIEQSRLVRVFKEDSDFDIVTYICNACGTVYRKYEDKREVVAGSLMDVIKER